jgi:RimJ/RimL family protein N-acetyltransferase
VGCLRGDWVRLEPLRSRHIEGLAAAAAVDPTLYRWSPVPQDIPGFESYVETALSWRDAGTAVPFATVRCADEVVVGSTRFWNLEHWVQPPGHGARGKAAPDACEIGYSWLTRSAIRTAANTEAKLLMLTLAFEHWRVHRVCFHADTRNARSRAALERLGARFEGVLRAHRLSVDVTPRDSARYSILASEWPAIRDRLRRRLLQP